MNGDTSQFGQTIGLFLSTILITITYDFFKEQIGLEKNLSTIIFIFVFFLVVIKITEILIISIIEKSTLVKKMLLGPKYIDGLWVDSVSLGNSHEGFSENSFACIWIKQEKGHCRIEGKEFDTNCDLVCNWHSTAVQFHEQKLKYLFQAFLHKPEIKVINGFTSITMYNVRGIPAAYAGIFIDVLEEDPRNPKTRIGYINGKKVPKRQAKIIENDPKKIQEWIRNNSSDFIEAENN